MNAHKTQQLAALAERAALADRVGQFYLASILRERYRTLIREGQ